MPNTVECAFSASRKAAITCSPRLKLSMMVRERRKRWSFVDLDFLKPDWYLLKKPLSSRCFLQPVNGGFDVRVLCVIVQPPKPTFLLNEV